MGGVGWRRSGGVETDEGRGQEVSLGGQTGRRLALIVLESPFSFTEFRLQQVNFLNTDSHNMVPQNSMYTCIKITYQDYGTTQPGSRQY